MKLTLYGTESNRYSYCKLFLDKFIKKYNYNIEIIEESSISRILEKGVSAIPVLEFEDGTLVAYNPNRDIEDFNTNCALHILQKIQNDSIHKILVPIDFSNTSINAYQYARQFSLNKNIRIDLLHVNHEEKSNLTESAIELARKEFMEKFHSLSGMNGQLETAFDWVPTFPRIEYGVFEKELFKISYEYDLIIMGLSNKNLLFNNKNLKLDLGYVKSSQCPVLIVPEKYSFKNAPLSEEIIRHNLSDLTENFDQSFFKNPVLFIHNNFKQENKLINSI